LMRGLGLVYTGGEESTAAALARVLESIAVANGHRVQRAAAGDAARLPELAAGSRLIVVATPAALARDAARALGDVLTGAHLVVHTARSLEPQSAHRVSEILRQETCVLRIGALAGPTAALAQGGGDPAALVVGSRYDDVIAEAKRMLAGARLRMYGNHDLIGVELAAALGGALSFAAGVAAGLGFGASTRAVLETRGLGELARLGVKLGGAERTFFGLAGLGARIAHGTLAKDTDEAFAYGEALGRGERPNPEPEAVRAAREAALLSERAGARTPLLLALRSMLEGKRTPREVGKELMVNASVDE